MGTRILQIIPSGDWRVVFAATDDRGNAEVHAEQFPCFALVEGTEGETYLSGVLSGGTLATDEKLFVGFLPPDGWLHSFQEQAERVLEGVR